MTPATSSPSPPTANLTSSITAVLGLGVPVGTAPTAGLCALLKMVSMVGDRLTLSRAWQCPVHLVWGVLSKDVQGGFERAPFSAELCISVSESQSLKRRGWDVKGLYAEL